MPESASETSSSPIRPTPPRHAPHTTKPPVRGEGVKVYLLLVAGERERQTGGAGGFAILRKCLGLVSRFPRFKMKGRRGENREKLIVSRGNGDSSEELLKQVENGINIVGFVDKR